MPFAVQVQRMGWLLTCWIDLRWWSEVGRMWVFDCRSSWGSETRQEHGMPFWCHLSGMNFGLIVEVVGNWDGGPI